MEKSSSSAGEDAVKDQTFTSRKQLGAHGHPLAKKLPSLAPLAPLPSTLNREVNIPASEGTIQTAAVEGEKKKKKKKKQDRDRDPRRMKEKGSSRNNLAAASAKDGVKAENMKEEKGEGGKENKESQTSSAPSKSEGETPQLAETNASRLIQSVVRRKQADKTVQGIRKGQIEALRRDIQNEMRAEVLPRGDESTPVQTDGEPPPALKEHDVNEICQLMKKEDKSKLVVESSSPPLGEDGFPVMRGEQQSDNQINDFWSQFKKKDGGNGQPKKIEKIEWPSEFREDVWDLDDPRTSDGSLSPSHRTESVRCRVERLGAIRVLCITWNLMGKSPPKNLDCLLPTTKFHLVAIGTQECEHSIQASIVFTSKKKWESQLKETMGEFYTMVYAHTLQATHLALFAHSSILSLLSRIKSAAVPTGIGDTLGNKGGVAVSMCLGRTHFLFVCAHFAAHQNNVKGRNQDYLKIDRSLLSSLKAGQLGATEVTSISSIREEGENLVKEKRTQLCSQKFDRVFWMGDLNYRISTTRKMADSLLSKNMHEVLYHNDQLQQEMQKGHVFEGFKEAPLNFRPTYKYDVGTNNYDTSKKLRVPAWTDRVLFKPKGVRPLWYISEDRIKTSDHRPVSGAFEVEVMTDMDQALMVPKNVGQTRSQVCTLQ